MVQGLDTIAIAGCHVNRALYRFGDLWHCASSPTFATFICYLFTVFQALFRSDSRSHNLKRLIFTPLWLSRFTAFCLVHRERYLFIKHFWRDQLLPLVN
jgi:hypothetical protein